MNIVVLAGGCSPEREVSLCSGSLVANALLEKGHHVLLWDLCKNMSDNVRMDQLFKKKEDSEWYEYKINTSELSFKPDKNMTEEGYIGRNVLKVCKYADVVFMALHGSCGENGKLQAVFDLHGICYTGSGFMGSVLAMDKELTKFMLNKQGIKVPKWITIENQNNAIAEIEEHIGFPCVVKPSGGGSSIGVTIVKDREELKKALSDADQYDKKVLVEEMIVGREFSVGILWERPLPPIEIIPKSGFYDYESKYKEGKTLEICPAAISENLKSELEGIALQVHTVLQLKMYSRVDIMVDNQENIYVIEANTLPGMTPTSLLPQEAKAIGMSYEDLCDNIVRAACKS